jgi:hypothetical protein
MIPGIFNLAAADAHYAHDWPLLPETQTHQQNRYNKSRCDRGRALGIHRKPPEVQFEFIHGTAPLKEGSELVFPGDLDICQRTAVAVNPV